MYDLFLHIAPSGFDSSKRKNPFDEIERYALLRAQRITFETDRFALVGYARGRREASFFLDDRRVVALVGEAFLTHEGCSVLGITHRKIDASDVVRLLEFDSSKLRSFVKGNFTILDVDRSSLEALVVNSRFAISPFYLLQRSGEIYLTTSLDVLRRAVTCTVNETALVEREVFGYPIGEHSFLDGVEQLRPTEELRIARGVVTKKVTFDFASYYDQQRLSERDALDQGVPLFRDVVRQYTDDLPRFNLSLTGGFDGRTILATLQRPAEEMHLYSFGIEGSQNVTIPQQIARDLDMRYVPILLDGKYEVVYPQRAVEAVMQSDCLRSIEGANYPYAFEQLASFAPVVVTGIFGSELLRTFQNVGLMVSRHFVALNRTNNADATWRTIGDELRRTSYLKRELLDSRLDAVREHFTKVIWERIASFDENRRFYLFLLMEALRKYFGGEVHAERIYATNRFPYLDDEFVSFIFRSPFAGVYSTALAPTPSQRFRSQYFYAKIMERYRPELLRYRTDHGFSASSILAPLPLLRIAVPFLLERRRRARIGYREFKPIEWADLLFQSEHAARAFTSEFHNDLFANDAASGRWKENFADFVRHASFTLWLHETDSLPR